MWGSTSSSAIKQRSTSHSTADCSGLLQQSAKIIVSVCSGLYRMRIHSPLCRTAKQPSLTKIILSPSGRMFLLFRLRDRRLFSPAAKKSFHCLSRPHLHYKRKEVTVFSSISSTRDFFKQHPLQTLLVHHPDPLKQPGITQTHTQVSLILTQNIQQLIGGKRRLALQIIAGIIGQLRLARTLGIRELPASSPSSQSLSTAPHSLPPQNNTLYGIIAAFLQVC